jgi:hypothetical protein
MRFQAQCIPGREEDGSDAWWYVYDTANHATVWPRCDCEPSPLREPAVLIAEAYNEAAQAHERVRTTWEGQSFPPLPDPGKSTCLGGRRPR